MVVFLTELQSFLDVNTFSYDVENKIVYLGVFKGMLALYDVSVKDYRRIRRELFLDRYLTIEGDSYNWRWLYNY